MNTHNRRKNPTRKDTWSRDMVMQYLRALNNLQLSQVYRYAQSIVKGKPSNRLYK